MSSYADIETLRAVFEDRKTHKVVAKILELGLAKDRSMLRAKCLILSQQREVIAIVAWDAIGPDCGSIQFPQVNDIVLIDFPEGDNNQAYVTQRLSNTTDTIPKQAIDGDLVQRSLPGKKHYLLSDTQILLGRGGNEKDPIEPLVLGATLTTLLSSIIDKVVGVLNTMATGPIVLPQTPAGVPTAPPLITVLTEAVKDLKALKTTYLDTSETNITSQLAFTERGESK